MVESETALPLPVLSQAFLDGDDAGPLSSFEVEPHNNRPRLAGIEGVERQGHVRR